MKNKLTAKEKEAIAASAFKDAPGEELLYVSDSGTVLNQKEYEARANKEGCDKFHNKKEAAAPANEANVNELTDALAEMTGKKEAAEAELEAAKAENAALKEEIEKLKAKPKK